MSAALEAELRTMVQQRNIVFFLDPLDHYTAFVDQLAKDATYPVCAYRGSALELMLAMEPHANGVDGSPLLVHLPGFSEDTVKESPFFELYSAGARFKRALDTLVTDAAAGLVTPAEITTFRAEPNITLERADAWLSEKLAGRGTDLDAQLATLSPVALVDDLLGGGLLAQRIARANDPLHYQPVWRHLSTAFGMTSTWMEHVFGDLWQDELKSLRDAKPIDVADAIASWAMAVEYVHDLSRPPRADEIALEGVAALPRAVVETCNATAHHLRERHDVFYTRVARETADILSAERKNVSAADLGRIDTFAFEEDAILEGALAALTAGEYARAEQWAAERAKGGYFWTRRAPLRQSAWLLVCDAARLGLAIEAAGSSLACTTLDAAIERYVQKGASVDRAHRLLEQRCFTLLEQQLPRYETLKARIDGMRERWRKWADAWARDWNKICRDTGFLPDPSLQQRTLFDQVVKPLTSDHDITAFFMVDAMRFEMAEELYREIDEGPGAQKTLKARLAELPTVTEVGMNVLAPVAFGEKLRPELVDGRTKVKGFSTGEYRVSDPESRRRAMNERVGGRTCPLIKLRGVLDADPATLKRQVQQARLVVVHSEEIDQAGEIGSGVSMFDKALQDLRAAWRILREAGVRRFVFTSDHGFLLLDERFGAAQPRGRKIDPQRRHAFSVAAEDGADEARASFKELGYETSDGVERHVIFPASVAAFDTGDRVRAFVHGGNSPQERVIPVLTLVHKRPAGADTHVYKLTAQKKAIEGAAGVHCIEARVHVEPADGALDFGAKKSLELGLRALDALGGTTVDPMFVVRGGRLGGSVIHAEVGTDIEIVFRVQGPPTDQRVSIELHPTGAEANVRSVIIEERFGVMPTQINVPVAGATDASSALPSPTPPAATAGDPKRAWLLDLPAGAREVFAHLATHGSITGDEVDHLLGGARAHRQFNRVFEKHAARVPFPVRIEFVNNVKRYVRDGAVS